MPQKAILIFDIGKTNKKALLFDENLKELDSRSEQLPTKPDEDGFPSESLRRLPEWVLSTLDDYLEMPAYDIAAVNISAYGATLVHIAADGKPIPPIYDYLKPIPDHCVENFYAENGGKAALCRATASPVLKMLNTGVHLYWLKNCKQEKYAQTQYSLHLPQFLAYLIHGKAATEITSLGCHTALWDFEKQHYHPWVRKEGLDQKLPPLLPTGHTETVQRKGNTFEVGIGIHDSSAALAAYLAAIQKPFVLVSTGTWSITLNAFSQDALSEADMQNDCLNYLGYEGQQVRASRFFLGNEHDLQVQKLSEQFGTSPDHFKSVKPDETLWKWAQEQAAAQMLAYNGSPMFQIDYSDCPSFAAAYHLLMYNLLTGQVQSIERAMGSSEAREVYLSGGFCNNPLYTKFLAKLLPQYTLYQTDLTQASAMGAAIAIQAAWQPGLAAENCFSFTKIGD